MADFSFLTSVTNFFGDAFDLIQKGAQVYSALSGDDKEEKEQGFMKPDFASFRTSAARGTMRNMDAPQGLRQPFYPENVQAAMRYMANNALSDRNLQRIQDEAPAKLEYVRPNVLMSYNMDVGDQVGSVRSKMSYDRLLRGN